ncbi:Serine carboxypeptidase [Phytophthora infestans]|uniref:Carboxypeptidase n=1 Tax=Phytophthora infestans TaxID=4787 RepID=A0A833TQL5_PHYIN|nr:Serine carboxypeptidase [Phytophthora infestans]KAF4139374.1 Serine carboxypeptidase [Phytophthora infestans]
MYLRSDPLNETLPLTRGLRSHQTQSTTGRTQRLLSPAARRFIRYGVACLLFLAVGDLMVTLQRSLQTENLNRTGAHRVEPTVMEDSADAEAPLQPNEPFPGFTDEILTLAGKPTEYTSRLFSGYLPLNNGGHAFYFLAESQSSTAQADPVLLWLNGGPGSSSLMGCFSENGPLLVNEDGKTLRVNKFAWNQKSNLLCIESPVGVGFSYNSSGVYEADDLSQAQDLYDGLQKFFGKFPWLRENDFVVSGESYGGIYVPTTALAILNGNAATSDQSQHINLKKFVVGNGVNEYMGLSTVMFAYYHGLLSTEMYQKFQTSCPDLHEFEKAPLAAPGIGKASSECTSATMDIMTTLVYDRINMYDVYGSCAGSPKEDIQRLVKELLTPSIPGKLPHPIGNTMDLCLDNKRLDAYFNLAEVRDSMHANPMLEHWSASALTASAMDMLSTILGVDHPILQHPQMLKYTSSLQGEVTPLWRRLLERGVKGVIYHGDSDLVCNALGGLWAVESLGLPRLAPRSIWTYEEGNSKQTGGFVEAFKGISYVTVKGAGHLVPMGQPEEAKQMLDLFVLNDLK